MPSDVDAKARAQLSSGYGGNVLAAIHFGAKPEPRRAATWLETSIPNRPLSPDRAEEVLPAAGAVSRFGVEGAQAAADDRSIFVAIETDVGSVPGIEAVTYDLYRRLLSGVTRAGFPHVLRIWNYVPRIHDAASGLERYMLFCKGRSEAFAAHYGAAFPDRLPAASAVGCPGDGLVVHVLSAREPGRHVENPRQIAAYRYPERYGPKSPSFARGTVAGAAWDGAVFVSGTASIVGHESVFHGDPERQTEETMRNVCAVLDRAGVPGREGPLGDRLKSLRVYVRFPDQADAIRATIHRSTGTAVPTSWLQAEICREELLVEIEATACAHRLR